MLSNRKSDNMTTDLSRRSFLKSATTVAAGALLLTGPEAIAGGLFAAPSPDEQKKIGDQAAVDTLKKYKEVTDGRATHFKELGRRLVAALPAQDKARWDFRFHVLDSKDVNAFALPGGNMFLFTGLYERVSSDDALAAVTGHEMTHVRLQHWAKAYAQQQQRDTLILLGLSIFKIGGTGQTIAGLADNAIGLKYSRGEEAQADAGGLQNMVDAGYNPQGMIDLFQVLEKVSGNGGGIGGDFLSDHPLTSSRISTAKKMIASLQANRHFPNETPLNYASLRR